MRDYWGLFLAEGIAVSIPGRPKMMIPARIRSMTLFTIIHYHPLPFSRQLTVMGDGEHGTLVWAFGLLLGIDMIFGGASLIAMALEARKAASHDASP
jgi:hypothetical protein